MFPAPGEVFLQTDFLRLPARCAPRVSSFHACLPLVAWPYSAVDPSAAILVNCEEKLLVAKYNLICHFATQCPILWLQLLVPSVPASPMRVACLRLVSVWACRVPHRCNMPMSDLPTGRRRRPVCPWLS